MEPYLVGFGVPEDWVYSLHLGLLGRLLLAAFLGGIIGLEREMSGKPAGLRTNLLICVGSALIMELSINLSTTANLAAGGEFRSDPARIAAQIVSGIGFLGAGTIIQARGSVIGLTTAATIWVVAGIGMSVGARFYVEAIGGTLLVAVALVNLGWVERAVVRRRRVQRYVFTTAPRPELLSYISETFRKGGLSAETDEVDKAEEQYRVTFEVDGQARRHRLALETLIQHEGIHKVSRAP